MKEKILTAQSTNSGSRSQTLPTDAAEREEYPLAEGLLFYFPNALAAVSNVSVVGGRQHNLGPLHWDRSKSTNHADKILRHQVDAGTMDTDGTRHSAKVAWRALAQLEDELIAAGATPGKNAKNSPAKTVTPEPLWSIIERLRAEGYKGQTCIDGKWVYL